HHHDRFDGGATDGPPEQPPLMARILAVAERYEALTAGRGCGRVTPPEALAKVNEGSGTEFDPAVVDALSRAVQDRGLELNLAVAEASPCANAVAFRSARHPSARAPRRHRCRPSASQSSASMSTSVPCRRRSRRECRWTRLITSRRLCSRAASRKSSEPARR